MKILIIKIAYIGDVLLTTPLFYNLKQHYGESCTLDILVNEGTQGILSMQYLNTIHTLKRSRKKLQRIKDDLKLLKVINCFYGEYLVSQL